MALAVREIVTYLFPTKSVLIKIVLFLYIWICVPIDLPIKTIITFYKPYQYQIIMVYHYPDDFMLPIKKSLVLKLSLKVICVGFHKT